LAAQVSRGGHPFIALAEQWRDMGWPEFSTARAMTINRVVSPKIRDIFTVPFIKFPKKLSIRGPKPPMLKI
jgi:hypothetical protein